MNFYIDQQVAALKRGGSEIELKVIHSSSGPIGMIKLDIVKHSLSWDKMDENVWNHSNRLNLHLCQFIDIMNDISHLSLK